jgi:hypothetical protein
MVSNIIPRTASARGPNARIVRGVVFKARLHGETRSQAVTRKRARIDSILASGDYRNNSTRMVRTVDAIRSYVQRVVRIAVSLLYMKRMRVKDIALKSLLAIVIAMLFVSLLAHRVFHTR